MSRYNTTGQVGTVRGIPRQQAEKLVAQFLADYKEGKKPVDAGDNACASMDGVGDENQATPAGS